MAKLEQYREYIQNLLTKYGSYKPSEEDVEIQLIFDTAWDHYQILEIGWDGYDRIYNCVIHIDIKDEKIWIQHNMTDIQIAEDLTDMGVSKEDIVLGLQPSYLRQYTQYGVAWICLKSNYRINLCLVHIPYLACVVAKSQSYFTQKQRRDKFPPSAIQY